jgi:hypothetical protein
VHGDLKRLTIRQGRKSFALRIVFDNAQERGWLDIFGAHHSYHDGRITETTEHDYMPLSVDEII